MCVDRSRVYVQVVHPRVERPPGDVRVHKYVSAGTGTCHGDRGRGQQERHRLHTGETLTHVTRLLSKLRQAFRGYGIKSTLAP